MSRCKHGDMNTTASRPNAGESLYESLLPKLRPFQREAVEFATKGKQYERQFNPSLCGCSSTTRPATSISNVMTYSNLMGKGRILLADEMGLGKTISSLAIMAYYRSEWPLLVICPVSLRYTWPAEIEKFLPVIPPQSVYVCSGFKDTGFIKRKDVQIVIISFSLLQNRAQLAGTLESYPFHCVIVDESHNLKQKDSQRTQILLPILQRSSRLVLLSGTPALARPSELWAQLHCLAPSLFGTWTQFANRYCAPQRKLIAGRRIMDFSGSSNSQELHDKLQVVMVRRVKSSVLPELPSKQRTIVPISISSGMLKACKTAIDELNEGRCENMNDLISDEAQRSTNLNANSKLIAAYQTSGKGKAAGVAEFLLDWLEGSSRNEKILVFAHHMVVLDTLERALLKNLPNSHIRIDGSVPTFVRTQLVTKFQTCERVRVAVLSITASGTGLTLTAASTVLFAELHWTPGILAQCEDRAHRIGQTGQFVQILYAICKETQYSIDMGIWTMLKKKIDTLDQVIDGKNETPYLLNTEVKSISSVSQMSTQDDLSRFFAVAATAAAASNDTLLQTEKMVENESFKRKPPITNVYTNKNNRIKSNGVLPSVSQLKSSRKALAVTTACESRKSVISKAYPLDSPIEISHDRSAQDCSSRYASATLKKSLDPSQISTYTQQTHSSHSQQDSYENSFDSYETDADDSYDSMLDYLRFNLGCKSGGSFDSDETGQEIADMMGISYESFVEARQNLFDPDSDDFVCTTSPFPLSLVSPKPIQKLAHPTQDSGHISILSQPLTEIRNTKRKTPDSPKALVSLLSQKHKSRCFPGQQSVSSEIIVLDVEDHAESNRTNFSTSSSRPARKPDVIEILSSDDDESVRKRRKSVVKESKQAQAQRYD